MILAMVISRCGVALVVAAAIGLAAPAAAAPLWPGSELTTEQRDRVVVRGLDFIYGTAKPKKNFDEYASDYLWCFYTLAAAAQSLRTRQRALKYGVELAKRWRRLNRTVPKKADADDVSELTMSLEAAEKLGVRHDSLRAELERRIATFSAEDFLDFDPALGPPPEEEITLKGKEACVAAGIAREEGCPEVKRTVPDYNIWYDALITVYFGDRFGTAHGATFEQLMRWRAQLVPYPSREEIGEDAYYDVVYLVTHLVYTHNDYNLRRISPAKVPREYEYLKRNFAVVMADEDGETFAEFVEVFKAFGHRPETDARMAEAIRSLLGSQNADGSWGEVDEKDVYNRYHFTWTAICALIDFRFVGEEDRGVSAPSRAR